jgi:hypothetical protein
MVSCSFEMFLEELHDPLPPAEFIEPKKSFYGLLQCLSGYQLEQLEQLLSPSELLKGEKVLSLPSSQIF